MISRENGWASSSAVRRGRSAARASRNVFFACLVAVVFLFTPAAFAQSSARAKELGQKLLCVCGCNQILTACNHVGCAYSHNMLKELDERIARGESDSLILQSFVQEYGPTVLAEPPARGFDWMAWIMPVAVPLIAFFLVWHLVRRWRARAVLAPAGGAPAISPELLTRARREIDRDIDG
ncbi:MAG TPA: cytochrome c-type biogenesis protein CcmH [Verrucomicrobiae bacterium]|nr:cytochrome c-type biogenesis protein CcmH [Verrucomicrobiae bacterium]